MLYRKIFKVKHSKSIEQQQQKQQHSMDTDPDRNTAAAATFNVSHKQGYDVETKLTPKMSAKRPREEGMSQKRVSMKTGHEYDDDDYDDGNYTDTTTNDDPDRGTGHFQQQDPSVSKDKDSITTSTTTPDTAKKNKVNWKKPIVRTFGS
jgi:hypothetical protein